MVRSRVQLPVLPFLAGTALMGVGPVWAFLARPGVYTVPITDLATYGSPWLWGSLGAAIGATLGLGACILTRRALPMRAFASMALVLGSFGAIFIPLDAQALEEAVTFSGRVSQKTTLLPIETATWTSTKHGRSFHAVINPHHLADHAPSVSITRDAYDAITAGGLPRCLSLTVETVGASERLVVPRGRIDAAALRSCDSGW